ncbi:MAG: BatA and WFA domain-containing protein [Gemmatimonadota bacterium]|nr:BatA and WFA domain-containing protein [Gemmatimonadota bacterium]MDE2870919.1 BatA and WFA domain-containing protein [Gemmatimonadota bacterium]
MGFLNPMFLLAGVAVLVPVILHLVFRRESRTLTFPAIRYLLRTERDHARQIRSQQLLLLLLRVTIVVLLVMLGARVHLSGAGGGHDPTALALVLDNSLSTTIIEDGRRRLDTLKAVARRSVAGASHDDLIWVVRAGTPWEPAVPGGKAQALAAIDATEPGHAHGDLTRAVQRARALVGQSALPNREVHLFTDLQAAAFPEPPASPSDIPVVVFGAPARERANRGIGAVSFGDGLPPLAGSRTEAAVSVVGSEPGDTVGVRLHIGGRVRAAATAPVGATVRLPAGPFPPGRVEGYAEIDPDPLTADDRRYFAFTVRDPTPVALLGPAPFFLAEGLAVLEESGRISLGGAARASTLVSMGGEGLERRGLTQSAFVVPLADPARLPALNRRLAEAGIPYRYVPGTVEGARITSGELAFDLGDLEVRRYFPIVATDPAASGVPAGTLATLSTGDPWILAAATATGPYVLLASPLDEKSTSLPVSAAMIPLLEWAIEHGSGSGAGTESVTAGLHFRPPPTATSVQAPDGSRHPVDGGRPFPATATAGLYRVLAGDSLLRTIPVNPPAPETDLEPADRSRVRRAIPGVAAIVDDASSWSRHIFRAGRGPEPWRPLAALLLALLVVETAAAASRALRSRPPGDG